MTTTMTGAAVFGAIPFRTAGRTLRTILGVLALFSAMTFFAAYGQEKGADELKKGLAAFDREDFGTALKF